MIDALYNLSLRVPDFVMLIGFGFIFGLTGVLISHLSYYFWFSRIDKKMDHDKKLADGVHASILALIAFFMAITTTNELSSFGMAAGQVQLEGLEIKRVDRDLQTLELVGEKARSILREYVTNVTGDEWKRLAMRPQSLSPSAEQNLNDLWKEVRSIQDEIYIKKPTLSHDLGEYMKKIEEARRNRLAASINSIPDIVWLMLVVFFLSSCVLNGRNKLSRYSTQVTFIHMSTFGLMLALNVIIDNPFGGDTSIGPAKIANALVR